MPQNSDQQQENANR